MSSPTPTDDVAAPPERSADARADRRLRGPGGTTALLSSAAGRLVTLVLAIALAAAVAGDALNWNRQSDGVIAYSFCYNGELSRAYQLAGGMPLGFDGGGTA